jgi:hypothetical protein
MSGLYAHGMDLRTVQHLFAPHDKKTTAARKYHTVVDARKGSKQNNYRDVTEGTRFGRSEQNLITEFMASFGQLNISGDDMNIIQVGSPAVSRYHQIKGFSLQGGGLIMQFTIFHIQSTVSS